MCGRFAGAWAGHWMCQASQTVSGVCCRAPEVAGPAHRLGGGQVEDRRRTPTGAPAAPARRWSALRTSRPPEQRQSLRTWATGSPGPNLRCARHSPSRSASTGWPSSCPTYGRTASRTARAVPADANGDEWAATGTDRSIDELAAGRGRGATHLWWTPAASTGHPG